MRIAIKHMIGELRVLMTSPSLDVSKNVSGIASVVRGIIQQNVSGLSIQLFTAGKTDKQARNMRWIAAQFMIPVRFIYAAYRFKPHIVHVNGPLSDFAILRDFFLLATARLMGFQVL